MILNHFKPCQWLAFAITLLLACDQIVQAHFVFVYGDGGKVKVVLGEDLAPDQAQFLAGLKPMKAFTTVDGERKSITFKKQTDGDRGWLEAPIGEVGPVVDLSCPYGIFSPGNQSMLLDYSAKFVRFSPDLENAKPAKELALDLVPSFANGQLKLTAYFKGMPLNNVEISLTRVEVEPFDTTTDDSGSVVLTPVARYLVRAKHVVDEAGEVDGKKFSQRRYYCTLVLDLGNQTESVTKSEITTPRSSQLSLKKLDRGYADFPRGMTSFGAAVVNNKIYVSGGKSGRAHHYARSYQNRNIYCLDLAGKQWTTETENLGLQGLALVAHAGKIIRIGGLEALNNEGEDQQLRSVAAMKAFDPASQQWSDLPSLPQGRSSFDACVEGDKIYVVGGWTMALNEAPVWATEMLTLDLTAKDPQWQAIKTPFETRALAVRAFKGKIFAIGGITDSDGPTKAVHIFDIQTQQWTAGPDVPTDGNMKAFGCSAVVANNQLLVSTYDGGIYGLNDNFQDWQKVHQLETGRFFHQMLPTGDSSFAIIGGGHMSHGSQLEVEVFDFNDTQKNN